MIYEKYKLMEIAEKQAQIMQDLALKIPQINISSDVLKAVSYQYKIANRSNSSLLSFIDSLRYTPKFIDEIQNFHKAIAEYDSFIHIIADKFKSYDFSSLQNIEENRKFLDDIEHINPELYKEILKVYGDKPFHELTQ